MKVLKSSLFLILAAALVAATAAPGTAQTSQSGSTGKGGHFGHRGHFPPPSELNTSGETSSSSARPGKFRKPPTAEEQAKMEANLKSWAEKNNYTTSTDENGRLVVKDSDGNIVKPRRPGRERPELTAAQKAQMEAKIIVWAQENGYTTEKDEQGRLIAKDQDGNMVRPPREIFGAPPAPPASTGESTSATTDSTSTSNK